MLLKNTSARLITVRGAKQNYKIIPGLNPDVEVPNALCGSDFVKSLIKNGDIVVVCEDDANAPEIEEIEEESEFAELDKQQLLALCEVREISTNSRDTVKTLIAKLDA